MRATGLACRVGMPVERGLEISIGSTTMGSKVVGGGSDEIARSFYVTFPIHTDRFQHVSSRLQATVFGSAAVDSFTYKDIRDKGRSSLPTKTV
jgi:hypothetical protein